MRNALEEFEAQYEKSPDPWDLASSPYEQERYETTIASLAGRRYARGLELGASIGVLSERLAPLCDSLVTLEPVAAAATSARHRLRGIQHVEVRVGSAPEDVPDGPFDLIVCSEILYYFGTAELAELLDALEARLAGTLIAVHWRGRGTHQLTGDEVHEILCARAGLRRTGGQARDGYLLDTFARQPTS